MNQTNSVPKTTAPKTVKFIIPLIVLVAAAVFLLKQDTDESTKLIFVTNSLPDITLNRILLDDGTADLLESDLSPGKTVQLSVTAGCSELTASDAEGGMYRCSIAAADTLRVQIAMTNRDSFEHIIESGGEFYTGEGKYTIRVTNELMWHDICRVTVTEDEDDPANSPDILDTMFLPPGKAVNTRVFRGNYTIDATDDVDNHYSCRVSVTLPDQTTAACSITENCLWFTMKSSGSGSSRLILCNALGDWIITGLYHKNSTAVNWSENHLAASGIEPKEMYSLLLDPGTYDIRVVDEDNDSYTRYCIEVSDTESSWNVSMSDLDQFVP